MLALKYLLVILGIGLFGSSGALVVYDIYLSSQLRRLLGRRRDETTGEGLPERKTEMDRPLNPVRWRLAQRLAAAGGVLPLLPGVQHRGDRRGGWHARSRCAETLRASAVD